MESSIYQQIFDQLKKSNKILIALPEHLSADSMASGLALAIFLRRLQKDAVVASAALVPEALKFLPGAGDVRRGLAEGKSLVVVVDTSKKKLDEISYQAAGDKVQIYLKPKNGSFVPEDVSFSSEKFPFDAIVTIEAGSLESLGKLFEENAELFFETPKINIDNKPDNEYFGAINLIDVTASSVAEILVMLLEKFETELVDEDIATCLLAGIITKTNSFQHAKTTPRAFLKASDLVGKGGRQQEIIRNIYKTKSLPMLKLWGRALARLKTREDASLAYSMLNLSDFQKAGALEDDLLPVLKEMADNTSSYRIVALISELEGGNLSLLCAFHPQAGCEELLREIPGSLRFLEQSFGHYKALRLDFSGMTLQDLETKFLEALQKNKISAA